MNKENYINSINKIQISEDFKNKTSQLMLNVFNNPSEKNFLSKKIILSFASVMIVFIGAAVIYFNKLEASPDAETLVASQQEIYSGNSSNLNTNKNQLSQGITVPELALPASGENSVMADMIGLFVYQGRIYIQSSTNFGKSDGDNISKEQIQNLKGDYLGKTKGNINEWSNQGDYATEFASTIGECEIYTVKGYDSRYRLMTYTKFADGFFAEIYESFGGLIFNSGADYFNLLKLKGNVISAQWEKYNSWDISKNERIPLAVDDTLNNFISSLYLSIPIGEMNEKFSNDTAYDGQKFIYLETKDNLVTTLRLFKDGYVYMQGVGFFKVETDAFNIMWNTMPVAEEDTKSEDVNSMSQASQAPIIPPAPALFDTTIKDKVPLSSNVEVSLAQSLYPVGTNSLTLKIKNGNDAEISYGVDFSIEEYQDGKWQAVKGTDDLMFIAIAVIHEANSEKDFIVDLSQLNPKLNAGKYRVIKLIGDKEFHVEFELTD